MSKRTILEPPIDTTETIENNDNCQESSDFINSKTQDNFKTQNDGGHIDRSINMLRQLEKCEAKVEQKLTRYTYRIV